MLNKSKFTHILSGKATIEIQKSDSRNILFIAYVRDDNSNEWAKDQILTKLCCGKQPSVWEKVKSDMYFAVVKRHSHKYIKWVKNVIVKN